MSCQCQQSHKKGQAQPAVSCDSHWYGLGSQSKVDARFGDLSHMTTVPLVIREDKHENSIQSFIIFEKLKPG
ncbi:unnamed protein product [Arctogadus glacialis]